MKAEIQVTIVIPTYNSEKTLQNCLDSLLRQTSKVFEVVLIDGNSTDGTLRIVKNNEQKFTKFTWISEPDLGIYDAMNKGIELANEGYLYFMGSDDRLFNDDVIQKLNESVNFGKKDIIYGQVFSEKDNCLYDGEFDYLKLYNKNICHQAIFIKKKVFELLGNYNLNYKVLADWDHNIRWFYSPKVSRSYLDLTIANYADGGLSSLSKDEKFRKDKPSKFLLKGIGKLPHSVMFRVYDKVLKQNSDNYNSLQLVGMRLMRFFFKSIVLFRPLIR